MRQFVFILLIGTCALLSSACSVNRQSSPPAVGDACLVGNWSLDQEVSPSGWLYANTPVSVAGLRGARLTLGADGTETEAFAGSSPLVGALADGRVLSITIRGSFTLPPALGWKSIRRVRSGHDHVGRCNHQRRSHSRLPRLLLTRDRNVFVLSANSDHDDQTGPPDGHGNATLTFRFSTAILDLEKCSGRTKIRSPS